MTHGQDDWRRQTLRDIETTIAEAEPELLAIVKDVIRAHGLSFQHDKTRAQAAAVFNEIMRRSFEVGIHKGINMVLKSLEKAPKNGEGPL